MLALLRSRTATFRAGGVNLRSPGIVFFDNAVDFARGNESGTQKRGFAAAAADITDPELLRNIGISAHIDSGKTTLTERILFYTGRINAIHEVRGKDGVGAKMDSMDLEREKGITIQSAATFTSWKDKNINIIDTPGHVDFTVEVERALRVLDGAIMVLCGVAGVQSQSITVDRQMKRYSVPRVAFINKLDRVGADPEFVTNALREKLRLNAAQVQIPIGIESSLTGVVDLVKQTAYLNKGDDGEVIEEVPIPDDLKEKAAMKRAEMLEHLAEVDEEVGEFFLMDEEPPLETIQAAIRRQTIANTFVPVFMGSAYKNRGVQPLLDGVDAYLPSPLEKNYEYLDLDDKEKPNPLKCDNNEELVCLAFKLEEGRFGQLTYVRVYQGTLKRGMNIRNTTSGKKVKISRLVRMHSDEMEEVQQVGAGEIAALFGIECQSGDTFCDGDQKKFNPSMMTMFVPEPVVSLAISPKDKGKGADTFTKALSRFQREDPTFRVTFDEESKETVIHGMGELHLEVYVERMKREYKCETIVGRPQVNYRESIAQKIEFNHLHKKQSGGAGQFGRVVGHLAPMTEEEIEENGGKKFLFENNLIGNVIPPEYINAVEKGYMDSLEEGPFIGHPVQGVKFVLEDGQAHQVDSSEMAFRICARNAFKAAFMQGEPIVLEPIMAVDVECPDEYQGTVVGGLNRRRGVIQDTISKDGSCHIRCDVPLSEMFGYSTEIRSQTQAKGEFTMEFKCHQKMTKSDEDKLVQLYKEKQAAKN